MVQSEQLRGLSELFLSVTFCLLDLSMMPVLQGNTFASEVLNAVTSRLLDAAVMSALQGNSSPLVLPAAVGHLGMSEAPILGVAANPAASSTPMVRSQELRDHCLMGSTRNFHLALEETCLHSACVFGSAAKKKNPFIPT